jgi:hypothetical protein
VRAFVGLATRLIMTKQSALILATLLATPACGSPNIELRLTIKQYEQGNYNAAAQACSDASGDLELLGDKGRVRYLAYCGLTSYELGRRDEARTMLNDANRAYLQGHPGWLKPAVVDELYKALDDLEGQPFPRPTRGSFSKR